MSSEDHVLLEENLRVVTGRDSDLTARFYDRFFAHHPELRGLFGPNSAAVRTEMLTETLISAVDDLEELPWLECNMQLLGEKHCKADVTDEMYDWWAECVIETLAEVSGVDWNPRLAELWRKQIERLCALMRAQAAEASAGGE